MIVVKIIAPTDNELSGKDAKCDYVCGAFPPIVIRKKNEMVVTIRVGPKCVALRRPLNFVMTGI